MDLHNREEEDTSDLEGNPIQRQNSARAEVQKIKQTIETNLSSKTKTNNAIYKMVKKQQDTLKLKSALLGKV